MYIKSSHRVYLYSALYNTYSSKLFYSNKLKKNCQCCNILQNRNFFFLQETVYSHYLAQLNSLIYKYIFTYMLLDTVSAWINEIVLKKIFNFQSLKSQKFP